MIRHKYDQQRSIFIKRKIAERLADRLWTPAGRCPTVAQIQHTWSNLKRRRPDLVCEVGDRILSANSKSRRRLQIVQRPHRRLAIPQDVEEEETSLGEEDPVREEAIEEEEEEVLVPFPGEEPVKEEVPSPAEEEPYPEEEPAAPHLQPESSDEGEEAAEEIDSAAAPLPAPPPQDTSSSSECKYFFILDIFAQTGHGPLHQPGQGRN
ncbi:uncharacterized protein [Pyxicephalus adspersus]|uniref:uncharacterized protein n=1 Tax=Pyxicephalus adspersus TaxID=30357 RepID=UPI003B5B4FF6